MMPDETIATASLDDTLDEKIATPLHDVDGGVDEPVESFRDLLAEFETSHTHKAEGGGAQLEGTVV